MNEMENQYLTKKFPKILDVRKRKQFVNNDGNRLHTSAFFGKMMVRTDGAFPLMG